MSHAGGSPSLGAPFNSGPAPAFGAGAFGGGASGSSQNPNPFQPAPFTAAAADGGFGQQQQSAPTGFGATNTAGMCAQHYICLLKIANLAIFAQLWSLLPFFPCVVRLYDCLTDALLACWSAAMHLHLAMQAGVQRTVHNGAVLTITDKLI